MTEAPAVVRPAKSKRLAVFLDGTWNVVGDDTNVWRMKSLCAPADAQGTAQLVHYDKGVSGLFGGLFGDGVDQIITTAYQWLVDTYNAGDEIFLFGFSRGAYTARSLAGFVATCGLLKSGGALGVNQLYKRYRTRGARTIYELIDAQQHGTLGDASREEILMLKYAMPIPIKLVGVWDTVGDLGVPLISYEGVRFWSPLGFMTTGLRVPIQHGFHALAVDEHRQAFTPTFWTIRHPSPPGAPPPRPLESVEQRWFVGAHANVGGGNESDILPQVPLRWLMKKASLHGLVFREDVELDGDETAAPINDSYGEFLYGTYRVFSRPYFRPIGAPSRQVQGGTESNVNETIDVSVFARWNANGTYRPSNLADWAARYGVDIARLTNSVLADNPATAAPD
jgi:Uncharacterized alpha/beta hydrolase domain (DUF2235)